MTLAVTGHRPQSLGGYSRALFDALAGFAIREIARKRPSAVITGMALGWDTAVAVACVRLGIPFVAAIPFEGQESRWTEQARNDYHKLLLCASQVTTVCSRELVAEIGVATAMQERNRFMVDNSLSLLALWNGEKGGTGNCVAYAKEGRREIENVWPAWQNWWDGGLYLV